jgi:glycosyltransferase involved in cell wall biosynthesis
MRILYCAIDQVVPGTTGGSTHVRAVAEGLAALGHEVHVATTCGRGGFPAGPVQWHDLGAPFRQPHLRLLRAPAVARLARGVRPDVVVERYHNFGGEGLEAAGGVGAAAVLEVNAPVIDYPGSPKQRLDRLLVVEPLRRWRDRLCARADLIVTPSCEILPAAVPADRVLEIEWGADVDRFHPGASGPPAYARGDGDIVAVFAGAFRAWHGAHHLVAALRTLHARGARRFRAVFIGEGPELPRVREWAAGLPGVTFTGALPYEQMPAALARADIGVAPFDTTAHAPLQLGFYWSPLKVFEYMASGLPVVAPALPRIAGLVRHGREGVLYDPVRGDGLAGALQTLQDDDMRRRAGEAARERALAEYGWSAHCARLAASFEDLIDRRRGRSPRREAR